MIVFYPKSFVSYPGYTTEEIFEEFERNKKQCIGFIFEKEQSNPDSEKTDLCFGILL